MTFIRKTYCPHCGQSLKGVRHGVFLTPSKIKIFDLIDKNPGLTTDQIAKRLYQGIDIKAARLTIRSHINQINNLFLATNIKIIGPYKTKSGYIIRNLKILSAKHENEYHRYLLK